MSALSRNSRVVMVGLAATAVASLGCGLGSSGEPSPATSAAPATTTAGPSATGPALPAGWTLCVNASRGSSMGYPSSWHQPVPPLPGYQPCSSFQPFAFTIPAASDYHLIALNAHQDTESVATYISQTTDPAFATTLLNEAAPPVAGLSARRFEVSSTGEGLDSAGTRSYGYAIDRGGHAFVVFTIAQPGEASYAAWKGVVDQAVATLSLT